MAWISWQKICSSLDRGGLGVGSFHASNLAMLGKWWWRYLTDPNSLWKRIITSIHGPDGVQLSELLNILQNFLPSDAPDTWEYLLQPSKMFSVSSLRKCFEANTLCQQSNQLVDQGVVDCLLSVFVDHSVVDLFDIFFEVSSEAHGPFPVLSIYSIKPPPRDLYGKTFGKSSKEAEGMKLPKNTTWAGRKRQ
ncbi:RNA-directed DNA polymerase, eukaryota [Artemisia annua]|uniref:RNA-directed DNA polymerase, eukaryota n=1 Tax=Artemisia annua TaxID=35608 RepID=A0A2U1PAC4_ARTAN|nr:RNA-directed DNA polymerase, eukaryota [Artemisia annua]